MDLVVFPEYCLHGLSMNIDPAIMCDRDGPEMDAFREACREHDSYRRISDIIHQDPALTARVLTLANGAAAHLPLSLIHI